MRRATSFVLACSGFSVLVFAFVLGSAQNAYAPPPANSVVVVNTPAQAVPTTAQGTTAISGTVRDADNPARQPFALSHFFALAEGSFVEFFTFTVPPGKRLVVEYVSGSGGAPNGRRIGLQVTTLNAGSFTTFAFPSTFLDTACVAEACDTLFINHLTRLYSEPGPLRLALFRSHGDGFVSAEVSISGYFVDM
jgi:hypothetical protein